MMLMIKKLLLDFLNKKLKTKLGKHYKLKILAVLFLILIAVFFITINIVRIFIFFFFLDTDDIKKDVEPLVEFAKGAQERAESTLEESITGDDDGYLPPEGGFDRTRESASRVDGDGVYAQLWNALVEAVEEANLDGYTIEYILGTNINESGFTAKGLPYVIATKAIVEKPDFNLFNWSYKDAVRERDTYGMSLKANGSDFIGPFQINYRDWTSAHGRPVNSWSTSQWEAFAKSAGDRFDKNGDGMSDPLNYVEALKANANHVRNKVNDFTSFNMTFVTEENRSEMVSMIIAARYVGISARGASKNQNNRNHWRHGYPMQEENNPHFQLFRKAIKATNPSDPNHIYFRKVYDLVIEQSQIHHPDVKRAIEQFYAANGWTQSNCIWGDHGCEQTYRYEDGSGVMIISGPPQNAPGANRQDVWYPFVSYWAGAAMRESLERTLGIYRE